MAKEDLVSLNVGAEITDTDEDDEEYEESQKKKMSSSMGRSIDRLLNANSAM